MDNDKKNLLTYTVPALMSAALLAAAAWGFTQKARADEFERLSDEYAGRYVSACTRCGRELVDSVGDMTATLKKLRLTSSEAGRVLALEDIVRESAEASQLLSRVPRPTAETFELAKFIRRAGDYARTLSRSALAGEAVSANDAKQLESVLNACSALAEKLASDMDNGNMPIGTEEYDNYDLREGFDESEEQYPTLVYDGPLSEAAENASPRGTPGEPASPEEAVKKAEELFGKSFSCTGRTEGAMPCYELVSDDGATASFTVRGLWPAGFMREIAGGASDEAEREEYERLAAAGIAALSRIGYPDMIPVSARYYDGAAVITYVWNWRGAAVLGDMIKVWLDRGACALAGFDASGYLFSHTEREWHEPAVTAEEARKSVSPELEGLSVGRLAILPLTPRTEALCWEFRGEYGGDEFAVFVNAATGGEERIFIVVDDDSRSGTV